MHVRSYKHCTTKWAIPVITALNCNDTKHWNQQQESCLSVKAPSKLLSLNAEGTKIRLEKRRIDFDMKSCITRTRKEEFVTAV